MANKVRAAYDFNAEADSGELSIKENEILTVLRENIEGGWMEGRNSKGQIGLFPESYVVKINPSSIGPPSTAPPPLPSYAQPPSMPTNVYPALPQNTFSGGSSSYHNDPWNDLPSQKPAVATYQPQPVPASLPNPASAPILPHQSLSATASTNQIQDDDFDDDWSDEDEEITETTKDADKLSASMQIGNNGSRRRSRSQSRATSGSRTDLSTDDEGIPPSPKTTLSGRPNSSAENENIKETKSTDSNGPPPTRNNTIKDLPPGQNVPNQRAVARSRSAGPDTISNSGKPGASRMKTINRFSNFVKSGMESYILTQSKMTTQPGETHEVIIKDGKVMWGPSKMIYTCSVDKPKKESKLKGLKSFIAYSVTSTLSGIQVSRRYKHFDWLHEQLTNKYLLIPIPPLPEKQVSGRYEEDLIEHRKCILQLWVNKICRHPVLSQSEVWQHFITTTDEKKWKAGKRQAEKDEYIGGNFFNCVTVPNQPIDANSCERQIESFIRCVRAMDDSTRILYDRVAETQKRLIGPYKSNWQKLAAAFESLGHSFDLDHSSAPVKNAIVKSASVLHKIGNQHEEHGKKAVEQLLDFIYTYKGVMSGIPDVVNIHKSAFVKLQHNERLQSEGKLSSQEADSIHRRVDVVSYCMLAEINHMSQEANDDFRQSLGNFFAQEADFYINIGQQLGQISEQFKKG